MRTSLERQYSNDQPRGTLQLTRWCFCLGSSKELFQRRGDQRQRVKIVDDRPGDPDDLARPGGHRGASKRRRSHRSHLNWHSQRDGFLFEDPRTEATWLPCRQTSPADSYRSPSSLCAGRGKPLADLSDTGQLSLGFTRGPGGASFQRCAAVYADG